MAAINSNPVALTARQIARTIDKLAALKATIKALEDQESDLIDLLKAQGDGVYFSASYKFHVAHVATTKLDTKVAQSFLTPAQIIESTRTTHSVTGRLYAL